MDAVDDLDEGQHDGHFVLVLRLLEVEAVIHDGALPIEGEAVLDSHEEDQGAGQHDTRLVGVDGLPVVEDVAQEAQRKHVPIGHGQHSKRQ